MSSAQTLSASAPVKPHSTRGAVWLSRYAWGVLAYSIPVILWGNVVTATGSGAGCGDHWPLCNGVLLQTHPRLTTMIELSHRVTSGILVPAILALVVWSFVATPRRHMARVTSVAAAVFVFMEALLGALLVLLHLTANNDSPERAVYFSLHLANTLLLLASLALCAHFLARPIPAIRGAVRLRHLTPAIVGLAATLLVGVSGSLAALGDTLFPATSLRDAFSQDFSGHGSWLLHLRLIHPLSALVAGVFILWLVAGSAIRGSVSGPIQAGERRLAAGVVLLLLVQYGLGIADVVLLAPVWMQVLHLLGADLLWVALVILAARICVHEAVAVPHSPAATSF